MSSYTKNLPNNPKTIKKHIFDKNKINPHIYHKTQKIDPVTIYNPKCRMGWISSTIEHSRTRERHHTYNPMDNYKKFKKNFLGNTNKPRNNNKSFKKNIFRRNKSNKKTSLGNILNKTHNLKPKIINQSKYRFDKYQIDLLKLGIKFYTI